MTRRSQWDAFRKRTPIRAKGGIKPGTKQGGFGKSWWAQRWTTMLERFDIGGRLQRGRSYAREGQVLSIDVQKGVVTASVQGSRPKPYTLTIEVKALPRAAWQRVAEELSKQPMSVAKLLAGEMPQDIEQTFAAASVSLFPSKRRDFTTSCSCPDTSNPCKHIAAVYFLLGEEFDRNPFLIFRMRGMEREELIELLAPASRIEYEEPPEEQTEPLPADPAEFWQGQPLPESVLGEVQMPTMSAAFVKRLGGFPFWRGDEPFLETLEAIYREASERAATLL